LTDSYILYLVISKVNA